MHARAEQCGAAISWPRRECDSTPVGLFGRAAVENGAGVRTDFVTGQCKKVVGRTPWLSPLAPFKPPALVIKSGIEFIPQVCRVRSADSATGIVAPAPRTTIWDRGVRH